MHILIPYASSEGHTYKIVEAIAELASKNGHAVTLYDTASLVEVPEIDDFDTAIVAASVHENEHQKRVINFAMAHAEKLRDMAAAFVSVSLSAAAPDGMAQATDYVAHFASETGWTPAKVHLAGGALNLAECDYFQRQVLSDLLAKNPVIANEDKTYVFTDWQALQNFVEDFVKGAAAA